MNYYGSQIRQDGVCGADYTLQNPMVVQAYNGFVAYQPLYHAGCLKDGGGNYCFANAITNESSSTDAYPYYLPLGVALPGGTRPTCNTCLRDTMAIFANAASNRTQPVSKLYEQAAQQIDLGCGPNFVNATVPTSKGASSPATAAAALGILALTAALSSTLLL